MSAPTIEVVGLGPGGPDLLTRDAAERLASASHLFLRTSRHPAATEFSDARSFDLHYERCPTFDEVYDAIVEDLLAEARRHGHVVYAVPGSPSVAERTVDLLRCHPDVQSAEVTLVVFPALSFLELAFERLGVDPVAAGVRIVDGSSFVLEAAGSFGRLIVAQCWDRSVLSAIKLAPETPPSQPATVLFHLGLPDEKVWEVAWDELDRSFDPDHLTSLWVPELEAPVGEELVKLEELVRTLRERCPWDRRQTHGSLRRHLLEEAYEVLEVLDQLAATETGVDPRVDPMAEAAHPSVAALEEELGTFCSRSTSTPGWRPKPGNSPWPTWPAASTTSWSIVIPTFSAATRRPPSRARRPTGKTWRPTGSCESSPRRSGAV